MNRNAPTKRQLEALRYIAEARVCPTLRELGERLGVTSTNAVTDLLILLEKKGLIARGPYASTRSVSVTELGFRALGIETPAAKARAALEAALRGDLRTEYRTLLELAGLGPEDELTKEAEVALGEFYS